MYFFQIEKDIHYNDQTKRRNMSFVRMVRTMTLSKKVQKRIPLKKARRMAQVSLCGTFLCDIVSESSICIVHFSIQIVLPLLANM